MSKTLTRNWWLFVMAGSLEAVYGVLIVLALDWDGSLKFRTGLSKVMVLWLGKLAVTAGICTIAAGLWKTAKGKAWWLALNGLALCALGALELLVVDWALRVSFHTFTALFVVMAVSMGMVVFAESWPLVFRIAGTISMAFALMFLLLTLGAINLRQHPPEVLNVCMGSFIVFSAVCLLAFAWPTHGPTTNSVTESYLGPDSPRLA